MRSLLAVLLFVLVQGAWAATTEMVLDRTMDFHVHPIEFHKKAEVNLSPFDVRYLVDGIKPAKQIMADSPCAVVGFTQHLDGVVENGFDEYLKFIQSLSSATKQALVGVEVTCGKAFASHDVLVLGLTSESLAELVRQYKLGAFVDSESGLPCLKQIADRYNLVLIAAHPDSDQIPYNLEANSKYCDGFEMFDSKHLGFTPTRFLENCLSFYARTDRVTVLAGSDYHFGFAGALPTRSLRETAVSHVLLKSTQTSVNDTVEAIRQGQTYATSLNGVYIKRASVCPGEVWKRKNSLVIGMKGIGKGDLIYQSVFVFASDGSKWTRRGFEPTFVDDELILKITFEELEMPNAKSINIDFGGRALFSTIFVDEKPSRKQPAVPKSVQVAIGQPGAQEGNRNKISRESTPQGAPGSTVSSPPALQPASLPKTVEEVDTSGFAKRWHGWSDSETSYKARYVFACNPDGRGRFWLFVDPKATVIVKDVQLTCSEGKMDGEFALNDNAWSYANDRGQGVIHTLYQGGGSRIELHIFGPYPSFLPYVYLRQDPPTWYTGGLRLIGFVGGTLY